MGCPVQGTIHVSSLALPAPVTFACSNMHLRSRFLVLTWSSASFKHFHPHLSLIRDFCRHTKDVVILTLVALSWISLVWQSIASLTCFVVTSCCRFSPFSCRTGALILPGFIDFSMIVVLFVAAICSDSCNEITIGPGSVFMRPLLRSLLSLPWHSLYQPLDS